jgi:hypothetical protein
VKKGGTRKYLLLGGLALAAIASLAFLAACGSGSEDGPSGPAVPTLSDYVGTWAEGPSVGVSITLTVGADGKYAVSFNPDPTPIEQGVIFIDSQGIAVCANKSSLPYIYSYTGGVERFQDLPGGTYTRISGEVGTVVGQWSGIHGEARSRLTTRGDLTFTQTIGTSTFNGTYDDDMNIFYNAAMITASASLNASSVPKTLNYTFAIAAPIGSPILLAKQ